MSVNDNLCTQNKKKTLIKNIKFSNLWLLDCQKKLSYLHTFK